MHSVPIKDVLALVVPERWQELAELAARTGELPAELKNELQQLAFQSITRQYAGRNGLKALAMGSHDWLVTRDPVQAEAFQPGDGCPACIAGTDQALAFLRDHPDRLIALGNLNYVEVWND